MEQIVSGSLEKQKRKQLFDQKYQDSQRLSRRIEKENLDGMEKKLEETGLDEKGKKMPSSMSSQEEKVGDDAMHGKIIANQGNSRQQCVVTMHTRTA